LSGRHAGEIVFSRQTKNTFFLHHEKPCSRGLCTSDWFWANEEAEKNQAFLTMNIQRHCMRHYVKKTREKQDEECQELEPGLAR